jgi:hypothetical protein
MSAELVLTNNLSAEVSNRTADVDAEESRAISAELVLTNNLSAEISNRGVAIDNEASTRLSADLSLAANISAEASRIDVILDGSDVDLDQFAEIVEFVNGIDLENDNALLSAMTSFGTELGAEESRAMSAELVLTNNLSAEVSNRIADVNAEESRATSAEASLYADMSNLADYVDSVDSTEASIRLSADASIAADLSTEIESLADTDELTIELNTANNKIQLKDVVAAGSEGLRTFEGDIEVNGILTVDGVDVMAEISNEISRAEAAEDSIATELSTQVSYLISNIDVTEIDSFSEIVENLSNEVSRAESAELSLANDFTNIFFKKVVITGTINGTNDEFTLTSAVRTGSEAIYLNGLLQVTGDDYTVNGTTLTFVAAPEAGDKVMVYGMY